MSDDLEADQKRVIDAARLSIVYVNYVEEGTNWGWNTDVAGVYASEEAAVKGFKQGNIGGFVEAHLGVVAGGVVLTHFMVSDDQVREVVAALDAAEPNPSSEASEFEKGYRAALFMVKNGFSGSTYNTHSSVIEGYDKGEPGVVQWVEKELFDHE